MSRKPNVGRHDQNGSRKFLADEVRHQRNELNELVRRVERMDVSLATLIEESSRAREHRGRIYEQLEAARAENAQVMQSVVAIQAGMEKITKTVGEHETERQQVKGAANLAKSISGAGWGIVGLIVGFLGAIATYVLKLFPGGPPASHPGGGP